MSGAHPQSVTEALNDAPLSRFHYRAMVTAGMGFFTDAYDLFVIGVALSLIKTEWDLSTLQISVLASATLAATVIGALVFGRLADVFGRKRVYGLEAALMAGGALASAFAPSLVWLITFRFVLGVGIGGDYPVSAVIMSEYSNARNRGRLVAMVFSMQALGLIIGPLVALLLLAVGTPHDVAWRVMLGLGAVPAAAVIYLRRTLPESPRFTARVQGKSRQAAESLARYSGGLLGPSDNNEPRIARPRLAEFLGNPKNRRLLLATAGAWFLLDYAFYGNTISTPLILSSVAPNASLVQATGWSLLLFSVAAAPGYVLALLTIDRIGHRRLQWIGFAVMAAAFATIGLVPSLTTLIAPFLLLYGLSYFFTEFGPNVTTFVLPSELFPISARTTAHGIAAAGGKVGAFIGVFIFPLLSAHLGLAGTLLVSAGCALLGMLVTFVLPEPNGRTLEEISGEGAAPTAPPVPLAAAHDCSSVLPAPVPPTPLPDQVP